MTFLLAVWLAFAPDLAVAKAEPDLEKRSDLALTNADQSIDTARAAYMAGDVTKEQAALEEVRQSVDLSFDSLHETHKAARKSKYYKRAEMKIRALSRRLMSLREEVDLDERPKVDAVIMRLQEVHDELLGDIMSKQHQ